MIQIEIPSYIMFEAMPEQYHFSKGAKTPACLTKAFIAASVA